MYDFKEHNLKKIRSVIQQYFEQKDKKIRKLKSKTKKDKKGKKKAKGNGVKTH